MKKNVIKFSVLTLSVMLMFLCLTTITNVKAMSYNYDYFKNVVPSAEGLAYDSTYYSINIKPADGVSTETVPMDGLKDMEVYDGKIYILNTTVSQQIELHAATADREAIKVDWKNMGQIAVINENFEWEKIVCEFPFSQDYVTDKYGAIIYDENNDPYTIEECLVNQLNTYYGFTTPLESITANQAKAETALYTAGGKVERRAPYIPYSEDNSRHAIRLRSPEGITVTELGIYIADTEANQIVHLNFNFEVINVYLTPNDVEFYQVSSGVPSNELIGSQTFRPEKVAVDVSGRVYCIAKDIDAGIIEFGKADSILRTGVFNRFLGKNEVVANPLKAFWGKIFSEAQLSSLILDFPPIFSNITMDSEGFLYATSVPDSKAEVGTTQANMVKAINTAGKDVMNRNGYVAPNGDAVYLTTTREEKVITGSSILTAVAVNNDCGIFTVLDSNRGRLFTYDMEGNLLYITGEQPGGKKTQSTEESIAFCLKDPIAVDYFSREYVGKNNETVVDDLVIVLDVKSRSLVIYKTTEFGSYVNEATAYYRTGQVIEAEEKWREVIRLNTNYELAYLGIGKSVLRKATTLAEYKEAMDYFTDAHSSIYYSKAFSLYRDEILRENFSIIMTVAAVLVVGIIALKVYKSIKKKREKMFVPEEGGDE